MAEYIKFRLTAAKAGVTMAFLGLLGGLAAKAGAEHSRSSTGARVAKTISWSPKLSLNGINGNLRTALIAVEKDLSSVYAKEDKLLHNAVAAIDKKLRLDYYDKESANATFLSQTAASREYMKDGSTAVNADKLNGLSPEAFFHGDGGVATGGITASLDGGLIGLLRSADSMLSVSVEITGNEGPVAEIQNHGSSAIEWVSSVPVGPAANPVTNGTIPANGLAQVQLGGSIEQVTFQFLPAVQNQAYTLILSTEPGAVGSGTQRFVGQMLNGDG